MNHNMRILFINMSLNFRLNLTDHILTDVSKNKSLSQLVYVSCVSLSHERWLNKIMIMWAGDGLFPFKQELALVSFVMIRENNDFLLSAPFVRDLFPSEHFLKPPHLPAHNLKGSLPWPSASLNLGHFTKIY